jgi:predicted dehydrogenase
MLSSTTPIDVVFVLTADQYHAEHVIACADAGKHVMIEKPMAQTEAEADAIEAARQRNGVVIFVGYMRRYATALLRMKEVLAGKEIKYVRVRDIIGRVSDAAPGGVTDERLDAENRRTPTSRPRPGCTSSTLPTSPPRPSLTGPPASLPT